MKTPLITLLIGLCLLSGCPSEVPDDQPITATSDGGTWTAEVTETETGTGWVEIPFTLSDASGSLALGLSLVSDVWMPAHGHGSSEPVDTSESETNDGVYIVSAFFTMPGEWEVLVDIDPDGADETLSFLVEAFTE